MSKQHYWSSRARRRDWSVNSLHCWRCLVINTPDETPSKVHPSLTGFFSLLLALLLPVHQAFHCFLLLASDTFLHLVEIWSYFLMVLLVSLSIIFLANPLCAAPFFLPPSFFLTGFIFILSSRISVSTLCPLSVSFFAVAEAQHLHERKHTSSNH